MTSGHAEIPPSIEDLWKSLLDCIRQESGKEDCAAVADTLRLLSVSQRGLDAEEIHDYLNYDRHSWTWGRYRFSDSFGIWRRFPALLQLAGRPGKEGRPNGCTDNLGLIHPSLQELLQSDAIRRGPSGVFAIEPMKAQEEVAIRCVSYLLRYNSPNSYTSRRGWTAYAGTNWHQHVKKLGPAASEELTAHCIKLLDHQTPSFSHWTYMTHRYSGIDPSEDGDFGKRNKYPSPLYYAALLGLHKCVQNLIADGADVNASGGKYALPIIAALAAGEERIVDLLNFDLNIDYAAVYAARRGQALILRRLLELGADVSYESKAGVDQCSLVHDAVHNHCPDALLTLIEFSAALDCRDLNGCTPLHIATSWGTIACMEVLLANGVDIEAKDGLSRTPLLVAVQTNQDRAFALLLEKGAEVDASTPSVYAGLTALSCATAMANFPVMMSLLEAGADINWRRDDGKYGTPLHLAVELTTLTSSLEEAQRLGWGPFSSPIEDVPKTGRAIVQVLLANGADPSIKDKDDRLAEDITSDPILKEQIRSAREDLPLSKENLSRA